MSDGNIVERLRAPAFWCCESDEGHPGDATDLIHEAADAIQSLEADKAALLDRVKVLEEALAFAKGIIYLTPETPSGRYLLVMWVTL